MRAHEFWANSHGAASECTVLLVEAAGRWLLEDRTSRLFGLAGVISPVQDKSSQKNCQD